MANRVRLVLALHNHQPIGNFDGVCEAAYQDSYRPFLEVLAEFPEIVISLHLSGSLLDWLVDHHPEYIDRVATLVDRGQIEILGGPYYEPILTAIPRRDRLGQIVEYSARLEELFCRPVRGMWVPERVWEQSLVGDVTQAGIEATILDDHHFRHAGLVDDELHGYYLTEDEGRLLRVFPGSERLRYTIPFADPSETIDHLRQIGERCPEAVVTFGDDGEKFGTWPGTREPVYAGGWLRRFFEAVRQHGDWLVPCRLSDVMDQVPPVGKIYIPDGSYREMTEWALPLPRQEEYQRLTDRLDGNPESAVARRFLHGGVWRNFRVKYSESNEMTARMLQVSAQLADLQQQEPNDSQQNDLDEARRDLYRAQCNCTYWHGAFGGLYLPHLRNAVYRHLIVAENRLERVAGRARTWCQVDAHDYNLDGRKEVRLAGDRLAAYFCPSRGGHLYELDVRSIAHNL
ncbi:MAG: alpha-amylase/4-alpha-glucanotransferase domain-containing protein, partial [Planctomycetaceae bacterium]